MRRSDYLNPSALADQCTGAKKRMEEDQEALRIIRQSIEEFAGDQELESESFEALKQQLEDYLIKERV